MPTTSTAPMVVPVPFTEADWSVMGGPAISFRITSDDEDCYTPPSHATMTTQTTIDYGGDKGRVINFAVSSFNRRYRSEGNNWAALFRLTYYEKYVQQGLKISNANDPGRNQLYDRKRLVELCVYPYTKYSIYSI